jgi:hypothetical protein
MYVTLGLEPGVPSAEIKQAYRNLSLKLHPDASRNPATAARFDKVTVAYKALRVAGQVANTNPGHNQRPLPEPVGNDVFSLGLLLADAPDPHQRAVAARLLGLSGKRSVWVFLRKGLYDPEPQVVGACVRAAAALGLTQGAAEIACAYERSGREVKEAILEAAKVTEDPVFRTAMQAALTDDDPARRAMARHIALGMHTQLPVSRP